MNAVNAKIDDYKTMSKITILSTQIFQTRIMLKVPRNSFLARASWAAEHCHRITADARNNQTFKMEHVACARASAPGSCIAILYPRDFWKI